MQTRHQIKDFLEKKAYNLRVNALKMTTNAGSGHPTSCLSAADLVAALFFYGMRFNPANFENPYNDHFILSKGHAAPLLYGAWHELGFVSQEELMSYRQIDSNLEGHPTSRFKYTQAATGALGMGLSIGAGMASYGRMFGMPSKTFVLMGDMETSEGQVWEAAEIAGFYKMHNLIGIIDCNNLGQANQTMLDEHAQRYAQRFDAFGFKSLVINGHDMQEIMGVLDKARESHEQPAMIIAKTIKGYGITSVENKQGYHGKAFTKEELPHVLAQLKERFSQAAAFDDAAFDWQPQLPENPDAKQERGCVGVELKDPLYKKGEMIATRMAFGKALVAAGTACKNVVSLDAEVKNSTFTEFFAEKYPDRFVECFITEQNMVSMAEGLERSGAIPFAATFGAFFTHAADQIRMAAIGTSALRLVGSHAGVSIGQDGPSQMALEDIAFMRTLPGSVVLYPCDAISTHKLVGQMLEYNQGISYLRTTRMDTPVIYDISQDFVIGGCAILRQSAQDRACVIGAGVTLFQALEAYEQLQKKGISISVIDLYSIKPLDVKTLSKVISASGKRAITVEDHYLAGGLGQAVVYELRNAGYTIECLAVDKLPRSGKPQELLAWAGIDAQSIVKAVEGIL